MNKVSWVDKKSWVVIIFFFTNISYSQSWVEIVPTFSSGEKLFDYWEGKFVSKKYGWFIGVNTITNGLERTVTSKVFRTTNGGLYWENMQELQQEYFHSLFALDSLHMWTMNGPRQIMFTSDGGVQWDSSIVDMSESNWNSPIFFFNHTAGVAIGKYFYHSSDGGKTWIIQSQNDSLFFVTSTDVDFANKEKGGIVGLWALGPHTGFVMATSDGGENWNYQGDTNRVGDLYTIDVVDSLNVYACGYDFDNNASYIYYTKDGGNQWTYRIIDNSGYVFDIGFHDPQKGWIAGSSGKIWQTTNAGSDWIIWQTGTTSDLKMISVLHAEYAVYILGDSNKIFQFDLTTEVQNFDNEQLASQSMLTNFPNPFNSQTTIQYTLQSIGEIEIKIYDLLGREIKTLLRTFQNNGRHQITWDGATNENEVVPSGLYVCRLTQGQRNYYQKISFLK